MEVVKERFEDAAEQDEHGDYEFYYSGFVYHFRFDQEGFFARQYDDTPRTVSFLGREIKSRRAWKAQRFDTIPYDNPAFRQAVKYLVEHENIRSVLVLLHEYTPVDLKQAV